jgi:hypothetical protein
LTTLCGVLSPLIYIAVDIIAARRYPGFSYTDQAVSELFAIIAGERRKRGSRNTWTRSGRGCWR